MDHAQSNLRMAEEEREALEVTVGDQQVLIKELRERIAELEKQKDELLVRVLSQCKGDCAAAAK